MGLSLAVIAGGATYALRRSRHRAYRIYYPRVRDAGRANMEHPPEDWDHVDQAADESFPASDPSGIYAGAARFR